MPRIVAPGWRDRGKHVAIFGGVILVWVLLLLLAKECEAPNYLGLLAETGGGCVEFWLNRYQTLVGALVALGGALLTVSAIRHQIAAQVALANEQRRRESWAARAVLPLTLSSVCTYAGDCIAALSRLLGDDEKKFVPPRLPDDVVSPIQDAIRFSEEEQAERMRALLGWLQVQHARMKSLGRDVNLPGGGAHISDHWVRGRIVDAAELYALAAELFDFARGGHVVRPKVGYEAVVNALFVNGIVEVDDRELHDLLSRKYGRNPAPEAG